MKSGILGITVLILTVLSLSSAQAETITGRINGYDCAQAGITCPIDPKDPHIALESDFVLQLASGEYLFLTNLSRDFKLQHVLKEVRVTGRRHAKFDSIDIDVFKVKDGEKWKVAWTKSMQPKIKLETITGQLNGYDCAHAGISCPIDPQDPRILLERDYVLQQANSDYMFLTNIPRSTKLQYVTQNIQVKGKLDHKYNTVEVYELMVMQGGEWKQVWIKRE